MADRPSSSLDSAIRKFESVEANLSKLERIWGELCEIISEGYSFNSSDIEYEGLRRSYSHILNHLPKIEGWKPDTEPYDLLSIAQNRIDAMEIDEISAIHSIERWIDEPGSELGEYRFKFDIMRRQLVRDAVSEVFAEIDTILIVLEATYGEQTEHYELFNASEWEHLNQKIQELNTLLGSSVRRPPEWDNLMRHLSWGYLSDLQNIKNNIWLIVKEVLTKNLYNHNEPLPTDIDDLADIIVQKPRGSIVTKLNWEKLSPDRFERLIYSLIVSEEGYENAEWLMHTNASDRGRDLSVTRIIKDGLSGIYRRRVLIQCKHYLTKSINLAEVALIKEQIKLWESPRVDVIVFATSGRFTADAVALIEKHNQSDSALTIEMWPESHLESLLAKRPALIAEFQLR
ncbi:restriction endonuclease [Paenibacillus alginolyticus]|uniref:restriction endonuclease n=1 Tax=Paenibacillus alginolyticus TaxID=59839 RepID=UPI000406AE83|nr:restriction endonuclease [Paenibacillus alginolyticus]MCY9669778.1 restriction endonuclease [Paenibacillus alginolyticus]